MLNLEVTYRCSVFQIVIFVKLGTMIEHIEVSLCKLFKIARLLNYTLNGYNKE